MSINTQQMRHDALRSMVYLEVDAAAASQIRWGPRSGLPSILNVEVLRNTIMAAGANVDHILLDDSKPTTLEKAQGRWKPAMAQLTSSDPREETVASLAAAFVRHVRPLERAHRTRSKAWGNWRAVVTWATARACLADILPMSQDVLHAFLWEALGGGCSFSVLKGLVAAIQSRHHKFRLVAPIAPGGEHGRLMKALSRFQGQPRRILFPISREAVIRLLRFSLPVHPECGGTTSGCPTCRRFLHQWRNCLAGAVSTVGCMRPDEGSDLTVCNWWPNFDTDKGFSHFKGGAALHSAKQKNDQARKGHQRRFGRSKDPSLDMVRQMNAFIAQAGLRIHPACQQQRNLSERCPHCPPLFPMTTANGEGFRMDKPPTPTQFSEMIVKGLAQVGYDPDWFSGVCARRGGISRAIEAKVPEHILWMQTGHSQSKAARTYMGLGSPELLYETWGAFQL